MLYFTYACGHKRKAEQQYHGKVHKGVKSLREGQVCPRCKAKKKK